MKHPVSLALAIVATAVLAAAVTMPATAQAQKAQPSKAERTIKYRQSALFLLGWNIGPIAAMAKGEMPFDPKAAEMYAARLAQIAPMIAEGFPADSQSGAPTDAKPEIWQNMDDFKSRAAELERVTAKFAQTAKSGDLKLIAAGLGEVGNSCKGCHEKYRAD